MNCSELQAGLFAYLDGEFTPEARLELETHLSGCAACRGTVDVERHRLDTLKAAARSHSPRAPEALKARLAQGFAAERRTVRLRSTLKWSAAAASVAFCLVAGHHQWRVFHRRQLVEDVAQRHARQYPMEISQPSAAQLEAWFGGKLDHRVAVPQFPNTVAQGARLLNVRERQAAYIRYDAPRANRGELGHLGLFVYGDQGENPELRPLSEAEVEASHGYNVVSWREGDVVYQLVTDLDEQDIRQLLPAQVDDSGAGLPTLDVKPASLRQ